MRIQPQLENLSYEDTECSAPEAELSSEKSDSECAYEELPTESPSLPTIPPRILSKNILKPFHFHGVPHPLYNQ